MRVCMYIYYRLIRCVKSIIYLIYLFTLFNQILTKCFFSAAGKRFDSGASLKFKFIYIVS